MNEVIAIVPARSGSKGVIDKNIKPLAGHPLIAYSIAVAKLAKNIDMVFVSTDSERYAAIARRYGAQVPFLRPKEISMDNSSDYDFIKHFLDWCQKKEGRQPALLVHLRPTTPLREVHRVEDAVRIMRQDKTTTALRSVQEMSESACKTFEIEGGLLKCMGSRSFDLEASNRARQKFPTTYEGNGYVDVLKTVYIVKNKRIHGDLVRAYLTPWVCEVDSKEDFAYLEYEVSQNPNIVKELFG